MKTLKIKAMKAKHINIIKELDRLYEQWSGVSATENSVIEVHDSAEAQDFAEYCINELIQYKLTTKILEALNKTTEQLQILLNNNAINGFNTIEAVESIISKNELLIKKATE